MHFWGQGTQKKQASIGTRNSGEPAPGGGRLQMVTGGRAARALPSPPSFQATTHRRLFEAWAEPLARSPRGDRQNDLGPAGGGLLPFAGARGPPLLERKNPPKTNLLGALLIIIDI